MNDQPTPFSPFAPAPAPKPMFEGEVTPARKGRGKGKKPGRKPKLVTIADAEVPHGYSPVPAKTPTKRKARVARAPKFDLGALQAFAGLKPEDAKLLANLVAGLSTVNKKSRAKIVAALAKVFE